MPRLTARKRWDLNPGPKGASFPQCHHHPLSLSSICRFPANNTVFPDQSLCLISHCTHYLLIHCVIILSFRVLLSPSVH